MGIIDLMNENPKEAKMEINTSQISECRVGLNANNFVKINPIHTIRLININTANPLTSLDL